MLGSNILGAITDQVSKLGKEKLHDLYPRDFELYMCAIELVDPDNNPVDYFSFPIMPKNISKTETEATSIQHSFSGITIFNKSGFIPDELNIQGDFGRSFKLLPPTDELSGNKYWDPAIGDLSKSIGFGYYSSDDMNSGTNKKVSTFPFGVKTGYGCIKILQSIVQKAKARDDAGRTFKLFFYNLALGESYLVVPTKNPLTFSQAEQSSNMIWQYSLNLSIIANLDDVGNRKSPTQMNYALSSDKLLGGITSGSSIAMSYRNMLATTGR